MKESRHPASGRPVRRESERGFSLIEVIIALGIFAVGVVGTLSLLHSVSMTRTEADRLATGERLATSKMEELLTDTSSVPAAGNSWFQNYGENTDQPEYRLYTVVEGSPSAPAGMRLLRVGALWVRNRGRESTITGNTLTAATVATDRGIVELRTLLP